MASADACLSFALSNIYSDNHEPALRWKPVELSTDPYHTPDSLWSYVDLDQWAQITASATHDNFDAYNDWVRSSWCIQTETACSNENSNERKKRLQLMLHFSDIRGEVENESSILRFHLQRIHPRTCEWFFKTDKFERWMLADSPPILQIIGNPGTGKSVLCAALLDRLSMDTSLQDRMICWSIQEFHDQMDPAKHLLQVLTYRLSCSMINIASKSLLSSVLAALQCHDRPMSQDMFRNYMKAVLRGIPVHARVIIVVDGLASDDWIQHILQAEVSEANQSRDRLHQHKCATLSRRPTTEFSERSNVFTIDLKTESGPQRDIEIFIQHHLHNLNSAQGENQGSKLSSRLLEPCADRTFLSVAAFVEYELCRKKQRLLVRPGISNDINSIYWSDFQAIAPSDQTAARRIFAWLIAASRPLNTEELVEALAIEAGQSASIDYPSRCFRDHTSLKAGIRSLCGNLVTVSENNTVRFWHTSVRDFLISVANTKPSSDFISATHERLAEICLIALEKEEDEILLSRSNATSVRKRTTSSFLERYARQNWSRHCRLAGSKSKRLPGLIQRWLKKALAGTSTSSTVLRKTDPDISSMILRIAAYHGFSALVQMQLEAGIGPNTSCKCCPTLLQLAVMRDHTSIVALLLSRNASIAGNMSRVVSPLSVAASHGNVQVAELLMSRGADITLTNVTGRTALHIAAAYGHARVVQFLISKGATVDAMTPTIKETPLHLAAAKGHLACSQLLMAAFGGVVAKGLYDNIVQRDYCRSWSEHKLSASHEDEPYVWEVESRDLAGMDLEELHCRVMASAFLNMRTASGRTALHLASLNGQEDVVRYLLAEGAAIETQDCNGDTPLQSASQNGHIQVVALLLAAGAKIDANGKYPGSVIMSAANNGHYSTADLLLFNGFSTELTGKSIRCPALTSTMQDAQSQVQELFQRSAFPHGRIAQGERIEIPFRYNTVRE